MTAAVEALGMCLSGYSSIPAPDSRHAQMASLSASASSKWSGKTSSLRTC